MANVTRNIGLSLGADICWPICFEEIMKQLKLEIPWKGDSVSFHVERVSIEPFNMRQPVKYDVVIDRLTHWYNTSREWIKKGVLMNGLYVFNNPWAVQSMEKHTSYAAMMALGMPIPETWMIPPKSYEDLPDIRPTLRQYAKLFDLGKVGAQVGYPHYMKPYDGGGWKGVSRIGDEKTLRTSYEKSGTMVMHLQKAVEPYDKFVRMIGFGPQTRAILYDPTAPLHDRYTREKNFLTDAEHKTLEDTLLTINTFFGWEFNSCESLRDAKAKTWHPIDFANPCPDSQVTSVHYHFPWLVQSYLKWTIYCATTKRKMRKTPDWEPYYEIAAKEIPYEEKLKAYGKLSRERLEEAPFQEFVHNHLSNVDEVSWEFFGTDTAKQAVRKKVAALFPAHEVEQFTELFWKRIQQWRSDEQ
ncbi:MAG: RimK family alpha-L-glutamate ligase [Myxococcaceae bacterium]